MPKYALAGAFSVLSALATPALAQKGVDDVPGFGFSFALFCIIVGFGVFTFIAVLKEAFSEKRSAISSALLAAGATVLGYEVLLFFRVTTNLAF